MIIKKLNSFSGVFNLIWDLTRFYLLKTFIKDAAL